MPKIKKKRKHLISRLRLKASHVHNIRVLKEHKGEVFLLRRSNEPVHEISNNVVYATSKSSDQPAHMRSLIRAFASRLSLL